MNFAEPFYLYFIIPAFLFVLFVRMAASKNYKLRLSALSLSWRTGATREKFEWLRRLLLLFAVGAVLLGLARPRWDFHWADVKHRGTDIMVVLDLSRSMLATDVKPNRLEKAKRSIRDLLQTVKGDRIGLILFSGVAFIQCPLTYDKGTFDLFLDGSTIDLLPVQGTEIAAALALADKAFEQGSESGSRAKTVVLISDGENHGQNAIEGAKTLGEKGVRVFSLAMGEGGSPIPDETGSFMRDDRGQMVVSKPDLGGLTAIAKAGGGRLIGGREGLDDFYRRELAHGDELKATREKVWKERHMALSLLGLFFLLAEFFVSARRVQ
ncbi:MAG: VWA domain-containing protein [Proteobacteria bacterium]|nr:MAG: VWA domain-containing protein [Pseudomonadota bacterium]